MPRGGAKELMQAHIRTVMSGHLITTGPADSLVDVAREIAAHGIGAVPVVDRDQRLLGIISTSDLVNFLHDEKRFDEKTAADVMTADPISIDEFATADEAIGLMRNALIRHLPVTREGRLVGMVTAADLIRHLLKNYPAPEVA
jgi:signal-transduction protein with cAMP-binding, CBS, and nucleotidyltransferase domain